jgi:hypothetical protein
MDELAEAAAVLATAIDPESEKEMELGGKAGVIFGYTEHPRPRTFALSSKDLENQPDEPMSPLCGAAEEKVSTGLCTPRSIQRTPPFTRWISPC